MPKKTIVKVQRPIAPADGPWLIYDEPRSLMGHVPSADIGDDIREAMGGDLKGYFEGSHQPDGRFAIDRRVGEQSW